MVSRGVGKEALAAVGFANQIFFPLTFIFASFNTGATAMVARYTGEKNHERVKKVLAQNLLINIIIGLSISFIIFIFGDKLLSIFDTPYSIKSQALTYLRIVTISQVFMFIAFSLTSSFRGVGDTVTSMKINGMINILNIIGNYLLIFGPWIFPALGIKGAAISTTLSRIIGAILFLYIVLKGHKGLHLDVALMKISKDIFNKLFKLSSAAAVEQFFMQLSFTVGMVMISSLPVDSEAAFQILVRIESISFMPAFGLSISASTLVGQSLGAKDVDKATKIGFMTGYLGIAYGIIIGAIFILFPRQLLSIFTNDNGVISSSIFALKIAGINQWALALLIILSGGLRGAGDTKRVMYITIIRMWLFQVPGNYIAIYLFNLGVAGIWIVEFITFVIFDIVYIYRFRSRKWAEIEI